MFWHTLARRVTHTSVAATKQIIGYSEFLDWAAYFEIVHDEEEAAIKKAQRK